MRALVAGVVAAAGMASALTLARAARRARVATRLAVDQTRHRSLHDVRTIAMRTWPGGVLVLSLVTASTIRAPVVALIGLAAATAGPRVMRAVAHERARAARLAALPDALDAIASALRAGRSLHQAIEIAGAGPPPLGPELAEVARRASRGEPLGAALRRWGATGDAATALVATAIAAAHEIGGPIATVAAGAAVDLREQTNLRAELRALAAQARASAAVLVLAPIAVTTLLTAADPRVGAFLLRTTPGALCLAAGLLLDGAGAWWMARICRGPDRGRVA